MLRTVKKLTIKHKMALDVGGDGKNILIMTLLYFDIQMIVFNLYLYIFF